MPADKEDQRRETGRRTRDRLLAAALELLAQRGPDGVTLREITDSASANVAAASYHFGSLKALCDAAIEHALERYLDAQIHAMNAMNTGATLDDLAAAFAQPMISALAAGGTDLAVMRTLARVGIDPPHGWDRLDGKFDHSRRIALRVLTDNLPGVPEEELIFRTRCAAGMLNWLALAPIGTDLAAQPEVQLSRLVIPVVAGAFHGSPTAA
jgi:AcrR family transcriptional regulator